MSILEQISEATQTGKKKDVELYVQQAIDEGVPAQQILDEGLISAMSIVGDKFSKNEIFVPEMLIAARAMSAGTTLLRPLLVEEGVPAKGKAVICTVKGDMHDIGKNLVRMMLEGKGIDIEDMGVDVAPEAVIDYIRNHDDLQLVCLSALLTTTLPSLESTVKLIIDEGLHSKVKILVGGAPVTQDFAAQIGADGYSPDAASAAERAIELLAS